MLTNDTLSVATPKKPDTHEKPAVVEQQPRVNQLIILTLEMLLTLPLGLVLTKLNIGGVAWLFGGIVSGALVLQACRIFYDHCPKPNRTARKIGMALVGLNVGFSIAHGNLASVASSVPVFVLLNFFLLLCGSLIGYIYGRLSKTNLLTAMLATVPGGIGPMSAIAAEYGRNVVLVALVQGLRITSVTFLIPLVVRILNGTYNTQALPIKGVLLSLEPSHLELLLLALLLDGLGVYLASKSKIPSGEFVGALMIGIAFNPMLSWLPFVDHVNFSPPPLVSLLGQMLLGITIGEYWGDKPTLEKKTIGYAFLSVVMTLVVGAIAAWIAMQLTSWDWLTCLLVTAPGGSAEMILVALALDHNVEIVTAGHLVRLIAINSTIPLWLFLFRRLEGKISEPV
ncbi:MAG: AbrB family transcriptional regulator [Stigonema ocellatum SAG 48.90 = DSM 106950]|nr:AbrB family transcriptional regulator [Stigonema ocellatum SAG 48.90 = DSM 106950]